MISFKNSVQYYYYRLKRQNGSNQVIYIVIFNHYNIFIISLWHILSFTISFLQSDKTSGPLLNFLKKYTNQVVQSQSLIDATLSMISLKDIVNHCKYS